MCMYISVPIMCIYAFINHDMNVLPLHCLESSNDLVISFQPDEPDKVIGKRVIAVVRGDIETNKCLQHFSA